MLKTDLAQVGHRIAIAVCPSASGHWEFPVTYLVIMQSFGRI